MRVIEMDASQPFAEYPTSAERGSDEGGLIITHPLFSVKWIPRKKSKDVISTLVIWRDTPRKQKSRFRSSRKRLLVEAAGIEAGPKSSGNQGVSDPSGAECGALAARHDPLDPDLAAVVDAWPTLPEAIRAGILALVQAAK